VDAILEAIGSLILFSPPFIKDLVVLHLSLPVALLVNPLSNSLLPEIARRSVRDALQLIDRTVGLAALAAVGGCAFALLFRVPAISLVFERGSFTAESTRMVADVFLGFGPSLIGWSLMEITARALFAMNRPWPPVVTAAIPVAVNVTLTRLFPARPEWLGAGSSLGLLAGFATLFAILHAARKRWSSAAGAR